MAELEHQCFHLESKSPLGTMLKQPFHELKLHIVVGLLKTFWPMNETYRHMLTQCLGSFQYRTCARAYTSYRGKLF